MEGYKYKVVRTKNENSEDVDTAEETAVTTEKEATVPSKTTEDTIEFKKLPEQSTIVKEDKPKPTEVLKATEDEEDPRDGYCT